MRFLISLAVMVAAVSAARGQTNRGWGDAPVYLYLSHAFYEFVEREDVTGRWPVLSRTLPYLSIPFMPVDSLLPAGDTAERRRYVSESRSRAAAAQGRYVEQHGPWKTAVQRLFGLRAKSSWFYDDGMHFARFHLATRSGAGFAATIQPVYGFEYIDLGGDENRITRFTSGARFEGGYANRLRFLVDFRDHTESGRGPYTRREHLYEDRWASVDLKGKESTSYDISESFLQYYGRDLSLTAGRGRHFWGPAQFGSLILNSYAPPFDFVRFDARIENAETLRAIYYTFLHGFLESVTPADTLYFTPQGRPRTINAQKFLSAQRLEIRPRFDVLIGISQAVIYGDRGPQLGYLTPLNFLYSVQHSNDDKDNFVLGLDGTWRMVRGFKVYGEAIFDDIVVGDLTKSTGNNKSAYTLGAHAILPRPFQPVLDATVEYTKLRPYVYSHVFGTNSYAHWYSPLGYTREPNSEFITGQLQATFYPVQLAVSVARHNHGANTAERNVGGDINAPNHEGNDLTFPFLAGRLERTTRTAIGVRWTVLPNLFLLAQGTDIVRKGAPRRFETRAGFGWNL